MADAARRFDELLDDWGLDPDRRLYRQLKIAASLPYLNEPRLLERLEAGRQAIERRGDPPLIGPAWERWLAIAAAWAACHDTMEEDRREAQMNHATEAVAPPIPIRPRLKLTTKH